MSAPPAGPRPGPVSGLVCGLVAVDKPAGLTSHDVVARCRRLFGQRQVGHAGTLDPDATGLLLVGLGRATRLLRFLSGLPKTYTCEIVLGVATSTLDSGGEVVATFDMAHVGLAEVRVAAAHLTGDIEQVPPMVSAVKVGGRRLHELARAGLEVERAARPVTVRRFEVEPVAGPGAAVGGTGVYRAEVECSSGTYVRSLAADLGTALGGGAHLRNLRRLSIGPFSIEEAHPLDGLGPDHVMPAAEALRGRPRVVVDAATAADVGHGKVLERAALGLEAGQPGPWTGPWAVVDAAGALLAVYEPYGPTSVKPAVVLAAQAQGTTWTT